MENQDQSQGRVKCYPECPMYSLSTENECAYNIAMMIGTKKEQVEYGKPCIHPNTFKTLVVEQDDKGTLVARLV